MANSIYWTQIISDNLPMWLSGIWQTFWLVGLSLLIGLCIAIPCGVLLASRCSVIWKLPVMIYSYIFRGTPMLVQLYAFYYGIGLVIGRVPGVRDFILWPLMRQAWPWVLLAFILNTAAYTLEIVRGAIETTPHGEIDAGKAMGMTRGQIRRRIIFPGALRRALPSYGNEIIFMLHGSAIASTATLLDITGVANNLYTRYYEPFVPFLTAAVIYLCITLCIVGIFRTIEKRLNISL
ncbi:MAG: ABC transporter permease subunit [Cardiobacteriaceae bacterium]|nr:ABC transporter permease subunit [Cardiobacteriaceae bacterium]